MKIKALLFFVLVGCVMASASVVNFTYGDGSTLAVQGTLTGTFTGSVFTATSATGTYSDTHNDYSISLVAPGVDPAFAYNNLVDFPPISNYYVDFYGLLFNIAGLGDVNLCATTDCAGSDSYTNISNFDGYVNTNVSATFAWPTPEPGTLLTLGSGIIGLAAILRRKSNR